MAARTDKLLFLGIDGMDPRITKKYLAEGIMPNLAKLLERGAANKALEMIGGEPTVTPPMWTTLATGASPRVHGVTAYQRTGKDRVSTEYNFDSRKCMAEQFWNVTAEAGKKTLVWHWPGSSWPPSSDSENLCVVDGTQPGGPNGGVAVVDGEKLVVAGAQTREVTYKAKAANDSKVPCLIDDAVIEEQNTPDGHALTHVKENRLVNTWANLSATMKVMAAPPLDVCFSPLKDAQGWANAPTDAKEFTILNSNGLVRRPCLLKKQDGKYHIVEIYKNKKDLTPIAVLENDQYTEGVVDEVFHHDQTVLANRNMRVLEIAEDGSKLVLWMSNAMDFSIADVWSPRSLLADIVTHVGYPQPVAVAGGEERLFRKCTHATWEAALEWNANSINYLIEEYGFDVVFSHFHNIDLQGHMIVQYLKNGNDRLSAEIYQSFMRDVYKQTDRYIGRFLHLLDQGWSILLVSDHGQSCPEYAAYQPLLNDGAVTATHMVDWGYTVLKKDADGHDLREIDLSQSKAIMDNTGMIYINLKGREESGIVDPEDQYELEEEIITKLYELKDPHSGHRVINMALHNRDAAIFGEGGPEAGDIIFKLASGYNLDHADSLSTTEGYFDTSVASIFVAAGSGIKKDYLTERMIKHVDVVPTAAVLLGTKMPTQCEGAPVYQILEEDLF